MPPHSIEAEMATLGSVLISDSGAERMTGMVEASDFHIPKHRRVFEVIAYLADEQQPADVTTVAAELDRRGWLEGIGGWHYLNDLNKATPTAAHLEHYADIVRQCSLKRQFAQAGERIVAMAFGNEVTAQEIATKAETMLAGIQLNRGLSKPVPAEKMFADALGRLIDRQNNPTPVVKTGYEQLDWMLGGGHYNGDLIILAGRPSMGKSAAGLELCSNAAESDAPALLYSLEMSTAQSCERWQAAYSGVDSLRIRTGIMDPESWRRVCDSTHRLRELPLWVEENSEISLAEMRQQIRDLQRTNGLRLVVIDQLQTMVMPEGENENAQITRQVYALKRMARRLNIPIILQCQLNRKNTDRADKRPTKADLRSSGALEQAADLVILLHREAYYKPKEQQPVGPDPTEWIVDKNRNGPTGTVTLGFEMRYQRFVEMDTRHSEHDAPPENDDWRSR